VHVDYMQAEPACVKNARPPCIHQHCMWRPVSMCMTTPAPTSAYISVQVQLAHQASMLAWLACLLMVPPCFLWVLTLQVMTCVFSMHYPKTMPGIVTSSAHLVLAGVGAACCAYMTRHVTLDSLVVAEVAAPGAFGNRKPRSGIPGMV
jgi:hypothetical protein